VPEKVERLSSMLERKALDSRQNRGVEKKVITTVTDHRESLAKQQEDQPLQLSKHHGEH
jgi:hypothetical protein